MPKSKRLTIMIGYCLYSLTPSLLAQEQTFGDDLVVPFAIKPSEVQIPPMIPALGEPTTAVPSVTPLTFPISSPRPAELAITQERQFSAPSPITVPSPISPPPFSRPIWPTAPLRLEVHTSPKAKDNSLPSAKIQRSPFGPINYQNLAASTNLPFSADTSVEATGESVEAAEESVEAAEETDALQSDSPDLQESTDDTVEESPEILALKAEIGKLKLEIARLSQQNLLQVEKNKGALLELQQKKDKLTLENDLQQEQRRQVLDKLTAEKDQLLLENELQTARQAQQQAELEAHKARLELENAVIELKQTKLRADWEGERATLAAKNAILEEKNKRQEMEIQLATTKLEFEKSQWEFEKSKKSLDLDELNQKIKERDRRQEWESQANKPIEYLREPYQNGHLIITDRRIELPDWVILPGMAAYVSERIHYFNNKNTEYPIFLIIDSCEGGDTMEGAQLLETMRNSQAPVYVVVKTMAASMCAVIATLAKRSFALPNAVIVHHQIWTFAMGNKNQLEEQFEVTEKWTERLLQPVADKMGITMEEFVRQMYEHNSDGDWSEFADEAVKLKWIDTVVQDLRDTSYIRSPNEMKLVYVDEEEVEEEDSLKFRSSTLRVKMDEHGQRYVQLPPLRPRSFYFLHNRDNYYRY